MFQMLGQYVPIKSVILALTESVLILGALLLATWMRLGSVSALNHYLRLPYASEKFGLIVIICLVSFYYSDLYDLQVVSRRAELLVRLLQALGAASLILALLFYLLPDLSLGRGISALTAITVGVLIGAWRLIVDATGSFFRPLHRVLVAGTGRVGIQLVRTILEHPELHFKVVGFLDERGEDIGKSLVNPGIVAGVADLEEIVRRERVDRVVVSFTERRGRMPVRQLVRIKLAGVRVEDAHVLYERLTGRIMLDMLPPSTLIFSDGFRVRPILKMFKRLIDIVMASVAIVLLSPLLVLVSLAIYLESGKPVLFRQQRIGLRGEPFEILKFRTMKQDAEQNGAVWAIEGDPRITRVGRILRRLRLDELPQFVNVLRGEMSVVGPRPERPEFTTTLETEIPYYAERHSVRPGITGWAQIKYRYGSSIEDAKTKLEYDLFYIKHLSPLFDVIILLRTGQVMISGTNRQLEAIVSRPAATHPTLQSEV